jgi:hypothetical protein
VNGLYGYSLRCNPSTASCSSAGEESDNPPYQGPILAARFNDAIEAWLRDYL